MAERQTRTKNWIYFVFLVSSRRCLFFWLIHHSGRPVWLYTERFLFNYPVGTWLFWSKNYLVIEREKNQNLFSCFIRFPRLLINVAVMFFWAFLCFNFWKIFNEFFCGEAFWMSWQWKFEFWEPVCGFLEKKIDFEEVFSDFSSDKSFKKFQKSHLDINI